MGKHDNSPGGPREPRGPHEASRAADDESSESVRDLLRHSWIYSLAPVFQRLLAIVLIRLYTQKLAPGEFAVVDLVDVLLLLIPQLVGINLLGGLTRFYFEHKDPRRRAQVVSSTTIALCGAGLVLTAAAIWLRRPLTDLVFAGEGGGAEGLADAVTLALLIVPFSLCTQAGLRYLQVLKRSRASTGIQLGKSLLEAGLKLVALFVLDWGVTGFLAAILVGEALTSLGLAVWMALRLRTGFDWGVFRPVLVYSLPLLPLGLVQLGLHYFGRLMLEHLGPQTPVAGAPGELGTTVAREWVGVFSLGYKIAMLVHTAALAPFMQIWQPHAFALPPEQRRTELVRLGNWALVALGAVYLLLVVFARQAVDLLSGSELYREAWRVTPIVALAYFAYASFSVSQVALMAEKRTWSLLAVNLVALALGTGLGALLLVGVEEGGYRAAAFATLGCFLPLAVGTEAVARRLGWPTRSGSVCLRLTLIALLTTAGALAVDSWRDPLEPGALAPVLGLKALLAAGLGFSLWRFGLDAEGRAGLGRLVRDLLARLRGS